MNRIVLIIALLVGGQEALAQIRRDINGHFDFRDFLILSDNYGKSGTPLEGDLDGDGQVGFADFLILSDSITNVNGIMLEIGHNYQKPDWPVGLTAERWRYWQDTFHAFNPRIYQFHELRPVNVPEPSCGLLIFPILAAIILTRKKLR